MSDSGRESPASDRTVNRPERGFFIDNLLVRIRISNVMIRWTGLAPWEFEFPFPGRLTSSFLTVQVSFARVKVRERSTFVALVGSLESALST
jgi:hypothetical protein